MSSIHFGKVAIEGDYNLAYAFYSQTGAEPISSDVNLVVFVNGLCTLAADWDPVATDLQSTTTLYLLAYDRWNCGESDTLPPTRSTNDVRTSARDLSLLLSAIIARYAKIFTKSMRLLLVGSSIGCCIIRVFLAKYFELPVSTYGVIFLDSYISNTDFISLFPETKEDEPEPLTRTRDIIAKMFHPSVPNQEGLDRSNAAQLLPFADNPKFWNDPLLVIVAHDADYNVEEMVERLHIDRDIYLRYVQVAWDEYNDGLRKLSTRSRYLVAQNSAHFIYKDRADLVVKEIQKIASKL